MGTGARVVLMQLTEKAITKPDIVSFGMPIKCLIDTLAWP